MKKVDFCKALMAHGVLFVFQANYNLYKYRYKYRMISTVLKV